MNRYRTALVTVALVIAAAVLFSVVSNPAPATSSSNAGGQVFPVSERSPAPGFTGIDGWLNTTPLTLADLRGKVVLIDFWTFSCVNCVRTIPHLKVLYDAYKDHGLVIVGVHSPEFDFEKVPANVSAAVQRLGITWPVAIDSEMATWNAYRNQYWPAEYLLDQQGRVAYWNFGEGDYAKTAAAVAQLLNAHAAALPSSTPVPSNTTPELYAGSDNGRGQLADNESYGAIGAATATRITVRLSSRTRFRSPAPGRTRASTSRRTEPAMCASTSRPTPCTSSPGRPGQRSRLRSNLTESPWPSAAVALPCWAPRLP